MADLDIKKTAEAVADIFVSFFEQFADIVFCISSVLLGIAFARFVKLPGSPAAVNPETAVAVLLVWVFQL